MLVRTSFKIYVVILHDLVLGSTLGRYSALVRAVKSTDPCSDQQDIDEDQRHEGELGPYQNEIEFFTTDFSTEIYAPQVNGNKDDLKKTERC